MPCGCVFASSVTSSRTPNPVDPYCRMHMKRSADPASKPHPPRKIPDQLEPVRILAVEVPRFSCVDLNHCWTWASQLRRPGKAMHGACDGLSVPPADTIPYVPSLCDASSHLSQSCHCNFSSVRSVGPFTGRKGDVSGRCPALTANHGSCRQTSRSISSGRTIASWMFSSTSSRLGRVLVMCFETSPGTTPPPSPGGKMLLSLFLGNLVY